MKIVELDPVSSFQEIADFLAILYAELFGIDAVLSEQVLQKSKAQWIKEPSRHRAFKVIDNSDEAVAFFTLAEAFAFFAHGAYGIINELWVMPKHRSKGVGGEVLAMIKALAKENGWGRIDVSAPPFEEWIRTFEFYQKYGFVFTGKKLKFINSEI